MEKTIKIGEKEVRLNNSVAWTFEYRDQFGRDIIPTLMPILGSLIDVFAGMVEETGKSGDLTFQDLGKIASSDKMADALISLSGLEFVDLVNITWALAKAADDSIPEPKRWVRDFDEFPVDEIAPEVFKLIVKGMVSSKNLRRLQETFGKLGPKNLSALTQSSSQDSNEA